MSSEYDALRQPLSKTELFIGFTLLAVQGVGGVLAVAQHELVERRRWMSKAAFVEEWSIAQILPGPNIVNLSLMLGSKHFGIPGAVAAVSGLILGPLILVLCLAILFGGVAHSPIAQGALKGMGAVSAGLIIATGLKLGTTLRHNPLGLWPAVILAALAFAWVGVLRVPLVGALLVLGSLAFVLAYRALTHRPTSKDKS